MRKTVLIYDILGDFLMSFYEKPLCYANYKGNVFIEDNESGFAKWRTMLAVDGTDPDFVCEMAVNKY